MTYRRAGSLFFILSFVSFGFVRAQTFDQVLKDFKPPKFEGARPVAKGSYSAAAKNYGNKTTNLCVLHKLAEEITGKLEPYSLAVPEFFGISHDWIRGFLNSKPVFNEITFTFDEKWQEFVKAQGDSKSLEPQAIKILEQLRTGIEKAFDLDRIPKEIRTEIDHHLEKTEFSKKGTLLMVRSTGMEDTIKLANAGGNESITSVKPDLRATWQAMGK